MFDIDNQEENTPSNRLPSCMQYSSRSMLSMIKRDAVALYLGVQQPMDNILGMLMIIERCNVDDLPLRINSTIQCKDSVYAEANYFLEWIVDNLFCTIKPILHGRCFEINNFALLLLRFTL